MGIRFQSRIFNDKNVSIMRRMASEGKSASEIAKTIGSTNGSVRTLASRLGIRFQSRHKDRRPNDLVQMTIVVTRSTWEELSKRARQTGFKSASSLVGNYLESRAGSIDALIQQLTKLR